MASEPPPGDGLNLDELQTVDEAINMITGVGPSALHQVDLWRSSYVTGLPSFALHRIGTDRELAAEAGQLQLTFEPEPGAEIGQVLSVESVCALYWALGHHLSRVLPAMARPRQPGPESPDG